MAWKTKSRYLFLLFVAFILTCCVGGHDIPSPGGDGDASPDERGDSMDAVADGYDGTGSELREDYPAPECIEGDGYVLPIDEEVQACIDELFPRESSAGPFADKESMEEWFEAQRGLREGYEYDDLFDAYYSPRELPGDLSFVPSEGLYWEEIRDSFGLGEEERTRLDENGFVVTSRVRFVHPIEAYYAAFIADLPVFITADSVFHALHTSQDSILEETEERIIIPWLSYILTSVHEGLDEAASRYEGSGEIVGGAVEDVDLFLTVARNLLSTDDVPSRTGRVDDRAGELLATAEALPPPSTPVVVDLFGSERKMDFSQFTARGHYTNSDSLARYFRAFMWISRVDFRAWSLSYPSCPPVDEYCPEGHRQLAGAVLLADIVEKSGMMEDWRRLNRLVETLVGERDAMCPDDLLRFAAGEGLSPEDFFDPSRYSSIVSKMEETGCGHQRIASHILRGGLGEGGPTPLPISFTFLGQKFVVDSYVFSEVVWDRIRALRAYPDPLDAMFVLGNQEALPLLEEEVRTYGYAAKLADLRDAVSAYPEDFWRGTVYNAWLGALRTLDAGRAGDYYPEAAATAAWQHRILWTQLASWAQLRHDFVLYVKQSYTAEMVCAYPDGYVEPSPRFFEAVAFYAAALVSAYCGIEPSMVPGMDVRGAEALIGLVLDYAGSVAVTAARLAELAGKELCGMPWSPEDIDFLSRAVLQHYVGCMERTKSGGQVPLDGWFVRLYWSPKDEYITAYGHDPEQFLPFEPVVVDVHTCPPSDVFAGGVLHAGTGYFDLMVFSARDRLGGSCTVSYAGPVTSYHQFIEPGLVRLTDEEWKLRVVNDPPTQPWWIESFLVSP